MKYAEYNMQCQRRAILDILSQNPQKAINTNIISHALKMVGFGCGETQLATLLSWLESNAFIIIHKNNDFTTASITSTGKDVASGYMTHPDICKDMP